MTILIDPPDWPAGTRLWSHLASDSSLQELHAFAATYGVPRRGFERDHYDVPAEMYNDLVAAGAIPVSAREIVQRLTAAGLRRRRADAMTPRRAGRALLRPPPLAAGDLVRVTATSGVVSADQAAAGAARLRSWGLRVSISDDVLSHHSTLAHLAGSDEERAAAFTTAWMDEEAAAVLIARGGFGSQRLVDVLDWTLLAEARPKQLIGFSDVTALHQAVAARLGLATILGPVLTSLGMADEASAQALHRLLFEPATVDDLLSGQRSQCVVGGRVSGVLAGGNVAMLASSVGTRFDRSAAGAVAVLEDTGETPFRLDRLLTQLLRAGWFIGVRGLVLGAFINCGDPAQVEEVLLQRLLPLGVPMVRGVDLGHTRTSISIPLGVPATLDADENTLRLLW